MDGRARAGRVMERIDALAAISEEEGRLTRRFATPALRRAAETVAGWMEAAGLSVSLDPVGNVVGRYEGLAPGAPTFVLGSHLDTVRDAGRFDGALGVLCGIAAVERLHDRGAHLPCALEVVGFADEEGVRFGTAYLGSAAYCGTFDRSCLALDDGEGTAMAEAIRLVGGDPDAIATEARRDLAGYCEVHIEQGPVLEAAGLPVGVVTSISGQTRLRAVLTGAAAHAGTAPMALRRDALAGAAELVLAAEDVARAGTELVATVGELVVLPGAANVVPGRVELSLDVRHPDDASRRQACAELESRAAAGARARSLALAWEVVQESPSVPTSAELGAALARAVEEQGLVACRLASGAGHDAAVVAGVAPVAILFVRCAGGLSHHPDESADVEDVAVALDVLDRFLALVTAA